MSNAPNLLEVHARQRLHTSPEWKLFKYQIKDGGDGRSYFELTGAVCTETFKSGPRRGGLNWAKRVDERQLLIPEDEHRAFESAWEEQTGLCRNCGDTGLVAAGWDAVRGKFSRPCSCPRGMKSLEVKP